MLILVMLAFACVFFALAMLTWRPVAQYNPNLIAAGALCLAIVLLLQYAHVHAP